MHTAAFTYYPLAPGVEIKRLGCFYDHPGDHGDTRILMIRLNKNGAFTLNADRNHIGMTTTPGLTVNNHTYPAHTSYYSPLGETTQLHGTTNTELFLIELPRREPSPQSEH